MVLPLAHSAPFSASLLNMKIEFSSAIFFSQNGCRSRRSGGWKISATIAVSGPRGTSTPIGGLSIRMRHQLALDALFLCSSFVGELDPESSSHRGSKRLWLYGSYIERPRIRGEAAGAEEGL